MTGKPVGDLFGSKTNTMQEVIILRLRGGNGPGGVYLDGVHSLPGGYSCSDFEYLEFFMGDTLGGASSYNSMKLAKEVIARQPTSWIGAWGFTNQLTNTIFRVLFSAQGVTKFKTDTDASQGEVRLFPIMVKGYLKNYATINASAVINVNNGNDIGPKQRYEIDIESALGSEWVGKRLNAWAEIYVNSEWGISGSCTEYSAGNKAFFVEASASGSKIVVQTGNGGLTSSSDLTGNPFGNTGNVLVGKCRVIVQRNEMFITNTAGITP